MNSVDQFAKTLNKIIDDRDSKKPTPKDDRVTVTKVEGDTVWVHFPGGVDETPVQRTLDAKVGDTVTVRRAEGKAWITGNNSSPPTDDSTANYAVDLSTNVKKDVTVLNTVVAENIEATNARFGNVEADTAKIHDLTADQLTASVGYIEDLTADHITAGDIIADHATIDTLDTHYAQIDIANVNNAWIENGTIKKAEVFDENVFDLSGNRATLSRLDASKINVANLRADNLVVRRINGQPVVGGYTLIDSNSPGYSSKNPQALGWYEFVNADWVLSTDTTVDMTKAYYQEGNEVSLYDQAYIDGLESDLQQQIDGAVETYTGSVVPTLTNWPYTDWYDTSVTPIHDERAKHVGDIYYVVNSSSPQGGYCYRFAFDNTTHAYSWVLIKDSDVTKALSDISELQTFESETTSWIDETDEGLETIRTNHTNLVGVVDKTVKESVQLWFTKANTTAPNKPTAEVTSTSTAGNAWRKVVPAYNASYPHYYYCWQYKFVDGTFGWSDVVRDIAMGETQGTARDAKNTADAALPAQTFEVFESTTFTDLVDEVDEQSTTMTNMTTRLGLNADGTQSATDIVSKESALEQTVDGISTRVGKTEAHLIGMYATSSTAAGTAAKVATITPAIPSGTNWELSTGTTITVKFTNANTTASPTLNVNSKGAKPIKTYANGNLSEAEYKWKAGSTFTFTYNGTNWLMQDSTASVRMSSAETSITQNTEQIALRAKSSDVYTKGQVYTRTETDSAITSKAGEISLSVAQTEIGKIEVGGRNLLRWTTKPTYEGDDAKKSSDSTGWYRWSGLFTVEDTADGLKGTIATSGTGGAGFVFPFVYDDIVDDEDVVFSFDYRGTMSGTSPVYYLCRTSPNVTVANAVQLIASETEWQHAEVKFKMPSHGNRVAYGLLFPYLSPTTHGGEWIEIKDGSTKLEKGNMATKWSPSPEDYADDVVSEAKAEIKVTTDGISTEVSKKTDKATIISTIRQSAETVKIKASQVEIDGTSIFNEISDDVDGAISSAVDDITIGGKNIFRKPYSANASWTGNGLTITYIADTQTYTITGTNTKTDVAWSFGGVYPQKSGVPIYLEHDQDYVLTVYGNMPPTIYAQINGLNTSGVGQRWVRQEGAGSNVFQLPSNANAQGLVDVAYFGVLPEARAINCTFQVKLEKGNKATDWTPAPEDVHAEIDAKKSVHTLNTTYSYTYAQLLTYSNEYTTDWIVSSTSGVKVGDTVRLKMAVSNMSNAPVYIVGTVTSVDSETRLHITSHGLDTTIIDGGNILTNSIGANQIAAYSIGAKHLTISDSTNLATANEMYESSLPSYSYPTAISGGYLVKAVATNTYLMVCDFTANNFKQNDEIYYEFYGKSATAGSVKLRIWGYTGTPPTHTSHVTIGVDISLTTSDPTVPYSGTIKLTDVKWNTATHYIIGFTDDRSTKSQIYIKKLIVRRKNGGELIVDGSISTDKLAANAVTAAKIKAGEITSDHISSSKISASKIKVDEINIGAAQITSGTIATARIPNLSADKITSGTINIGRIPDDALNNNVHVGGRNCIFFSKGVNVTGLNSAAGSSKEYQWMNIGQSCMDIPHGTQVTISFDLYMTVNTANPTLLVYNTNRKGPKAFAATIGTAGTESGVTLSFTAAAGSRINKRVSVTGYVNTRATHELDYNNLEFYSTYGTSNWFSISNIKLEVGNMATDWSPAPEDALTDGINLVPQTHMFVNPGRTATLNNTSYIKTVANARGTCLCWTADILKFLTPTTVSDGEWITLSFSIRFDSGGNTSHRIRFYPYQTNGISIKEGRYLTDDEKKTSWVRVVHVTKARNHGDNNTSYSLGCIYLYDDDGNNNFSITSVKIERGVRVTDWSAAPIDQGQTATTYITDISGTGIRVHPYNTENNSVVINASGMEVFKGGTGSANSVAFYGDTARIGKAAGKHVNINDSGMTVFMGDESTASNNVAFFGSSIRVGSASSNRIEIDSSSFDVRDADSFLQFSVTPSSSSTSHTTTRTVGQMVSGQQKSTGIAKNATSFRAIVTPSSGSTVTQSISIPSGSAGAQTGATVGPVSFTLRRTSTNGYINVTMRATAAARSVSYSYACPRRIASITAGGYDLCYAPGDWIPYYYWDGSGYLTNSKTNIWVTLPVNKPILAENVTVANVYLITRQDAKYTHGSSADTDVSWTVESASLQPAGVQVCLSRSTTTNAVNNSPIGIDLVCDMTFS